MNNYHIIDRIGEGAHGIVLKATNISSGKFVALKKVPLRASIGQSDYQQESKKYCGWRVVIMTARGDNLKLLI